MSRDTGAIPIHRRLLTLAEEAVRRRGEHGTAAPPDLDDLPADLRVRGASFVTLERGGRLLGCIGSVEPRRPLGVDVAANAVAAAFHDPRFPPLSADDFTHMDVTVAVLSPLTPVDAHDVAGLAAILRPGVDGVLIAGRGHRATFLPHVWDSLPEPAAFLDRLWRKAGLRPNDWPDDLAVSTYTATACTSQGPRRPPVVSPGGAWEHRTPTARRMR